MKPIIIAVIIGVVFVVGAMLFSPTPEIEEPSLNPISEPTQSSDIDELSFNPILEPTQSSQDCSGNARCITGTVTKIVDGDTIHVNEQSIRFALASAPELSGYGGVESRNFIQIICPVGSEVIVDEDDSQTGESYGRIIGVVYCNGMNLNAELLDADLGYLENQFCDSSEFADESWAQKHGC